MIAQYIAKPVSFAFFTRLIITLHANNPETNADTKPRISEVMLMPDAAAVNSPEISSRKASPSTGTSTIKNENFAISSFLTPSIIPVEIVAPERESPGSTAIA
jgi:hypothetical protein